MQSLVDLSGRTVVVTGAAQGIGRAIVDLVRSLGGNAAAIDLNTDLLAAIPPGKDLTTLAGDIADPAFVEAAMAQVLARHGAVHGLVNNAGITRPALIEKMSLAQWDDVVRVHMTGSFLWMQAVGRAMIAAAGTHGASPGAIVNISSDAGRAGSIGQINYAAVKSGLLGMTMTGAKEWAKHGIRVNAVCFGVVETPMTETIRGDRFRESILARIPMGRWASAAEVAQPVAFLLSDAASYVTGQMLAVNGGFHISI